MTPELLEMAENAGFWISDGGNVEAREEAIEAFARLIAADCAKIADNIGPVMYYETESYEIACAIRAKYGAPA